MDDGWGLCLEGKVRPNSGAFIELYANEVWEPAEHNKMGPFF
jgi:hypothetical protein